MKLFAALILSAFFASIAKAEWLPVGKTAYGVWYVDFDQIQKEGNYRSAWILNDFYKTRTSNGIPYRSAIKKYRYDCLNGTMKALETVSYTGNMSQGKVVNVETEGGPVSTQLFPPESIGKILVTEVCSY